MTIRGRLALWNVAVLALALLALGGVLRFRVHADLIAGVDRELLNRARFFRSLPQWPRPAPPPKTPDRFAPPFFFDAQGHAVFGGPDALDPDAVRTSLRKDEPVLSTFGGMRVLTLSREMHGERIVFQTIESLAPVREQMGHLTRSLLTLLPLALLIAAGGGLFLTGRALSPVRAVTEAASQIGAGDLSRRLPVRGRDEFAHLAQTFNGMLTRLEDAFTRQQRFVADASHEIRTPLTVIKANSSLALSEPSLPDEARVSLGEIDRAADRTIRIAQDLLLLARSDAGILPLERRPLSVAALFEDAHRDALRLGAGAATIRVTSTGLSVDADPDSLHRLLLNLLDNALRHTPPDGQVVLSAIAEDDGATLLSVADTGKGIAPEHLPRLGERFYRPDHGRARRDGGTGLGLAISRAIAHAHGGSLTIESAPGVGTTVLVRLPKRLGPA